MEKGEIWGGKGPTERETSSNGIYLDKAEGELYKHTHYVMKFYFGFAWKHSSRICTPSLHLYRSLFVR